MHSIQVHKVIILMMSFFYFVGIWHRGDKPTTRELRIKAFYCVYYVFYPISAAIGIVTNESPDQSIFLAELCLASIVLYVKLWILIWNQDQVLDLLNRICIFSIKSDKDLSSVNDKIRVFIKLVLVCVTALIATCFFDVFVSPYFRSHKTLFLQIAFPLDYNKSETAFWIANIFYSSEWALGLMVTFLNTIVWYFLFNCSLRHLVLGSELKKIGRDSKKMTERQKHDALLENMTASIQSHLQLRRLINELGSFSSILFFIQFGTSGICICGSLYCLAFGVSRNLLEIIVHLYSFFFYTSELFMITYLGNEIKLSSDRLSYSLFESEWYEQPQSTQKCLVIFGECLKQPQQLLIGKVYPLTLETFSRILKSAYSMFNILKKFKD